jgi:hypothetical protein
MKLEPLNLNLVPNSNFEWGLIGLEPETRDFEVKEAEDSFFGRKMVEGTRVAGYFEPQLWWRISDITPFPFDFHVWGRISGAETASGFLVIYYYDESASFIDWARELRYFSKNWEKKIWTSTMPEKTRLLKIAFMIETENVLFQIDRVHFGKDATSDNYEFHDLPIVPFTYRTSKQEQRTKTQTGRTVVTRTGLSKRAFNMEFRASRQSHFLSLRKLYENYSYFYFYPNLRTEREVYLVHWPEDAFEFRELPGGNLYDGDMILEEV